ncbi:hypothetical protein ACFYUJ_32200 [Streptomyces sp. NPDC004520]|uniref:hypothetical protein n=1 Tax=Streptomyces sp. NPDC004520 TaxID=3364702 RepID=UPI00369FF79F
MHLDTPSGVTPHEWRECTPAITLMPGDGSGHSSQDPEEWAAHAKMERTAHALSVVLGRLSKDYRENFQQSFHRVCCLNSRGPEEILVVNQVLHLLDEEMERPDYC